jgi:hypothetical protein
MISGINKDYKENLGAGDNYADAASVVACLPVGRRRNSFIVLFNIQQL